MTDAVEEFTIAGSATESFDASEVFGDVLDKPAEPVAKETTAQKQAHKSGIKEMKEYSENKKLSPEEVVERQTLLLKLNRYATSNRFSDYLKDMGFDLHAKSLAKKSKDELEDLMIEIQTTVNSKSSSNIFLQATMLGANVLEGLTQNPNIKPRLDLAGFGASISEDQDLLDAIEAVALEYGSLCMMTPPMKMMYCLLANGARVSAMNKVQAIIKARLQQQAESLRPAVITASVSNPATIADESASSTLVLDTITESVIPLQNLVIDQASSTLPSLDQPKTLELDFNI